MKFEIVLGLLLHAIHRGIGILHERLLILAILREKADPDAGRYTVWRARLLRGPRYSRQYLLRDHGGVLRLRNVLEQHYKLVSTQPGHNVVLPQTRLESASNVP